MEERDGVREREEENDTSIYTGLLEAITIAVALCSPATLMCIDEPSANWHPAAQARQVPVALSLSFSLSVSSS